MTNVICHMGIEPLIKLQMFCTGNYSGWKLNAYFEFFTLDTNKILFI